MYSRNGWEELDNKNATATRWIRNNISFFIKLNKKIRFSEQKFKNYSSAVLLSK